MTTLPPCTQNHKNSDDEHNDQDHNRGTLIVFEGLDRSGKSTQCLRLVENLKSKQHGRDVVHMRFPDRTTIIGKMIDEYLRGGSDQEDHVIHLLFSANRWEAVAKIETALGQGKHVVIDRYYYSGAVYSAAKKNPRLDLAWARKPDEGLPRPDVCFFLGISAEAASRRGNFGTEKYEVKEMQDRVRQLYEAMQRQAAEKEDFVLVDGGQSMEHVESVILDEAERVIERVARSRLPLRHVEPW